MDITPWFQFGFPAALTVLILVGLGFGAKWFLKKYLEQQKREFDTREAERQRQAQVIGEQRDFIKGLATQAIEAGKQSIATQTKTAQALDEIVETLQAFKTEFSHQLSLKTSHLGELSADHKEIKTAIRDLERTTLVKQATAPD